MSPLETAQTAVVILASLGGGGAIVRAFSAYLGKRWAEKALEEQRHKLDLITRKVQIELDRLGLVHKLRIQEEFDRLAGLWEKTSTLKEAFNRMANGRSVPAYDDAAVKQEWEASDHKAFLEALDDARTFLRRGMLFIPKQIANTAEGAINFAFREKLGYEGMSPYLGVGGDMSSEYLRIRNSLLAEFNEATNKLEALMRKQIGGQETLPVID
jgi:hypothetical protein